MPPEANQVGSGLPRRSVLRAAALGSAAWVAPAVAIANAAPAVAASAPALPASVGVYVHQFLPVAETNAKQITVRLGVNMSQGTNGVAMAAQVKASYTVTSSAGEVYGPYVVSVGPSGGISDFFSIPEEFPAGTYTVAAEISAVVTKWQQYNPHAVFDGSWPVEPEWRTSQQVQVTVL